jgi:hypothetical protein
MIATVILLLLVVVFASVFSSAQTGLITLRNSALRRQNAQTALMTMAGELKAAVAPQGGFYEGANPADRQLPLLINPPTLGMDPATHNAHSIFWPVKSSSSDGGTSLVGYVVRWMQESGKPPRPMLCRMKLGAAQLQSVLEGQQGTPSPGDWPASGLVDAATKGDADSGFAGWLADDILALYVRALDYEMKPIKALPRKISGPKATGEPGVLFDAVLTGGVLTNSFDSRAGYQYSTNSVLVNRFGPAFPAAVEIVVVSATPKAIRLLGSIPASVASADSSLLWSDVDAFVASLPQALRSEVKTYSVIVPLFPG